MRKEQSSADEEKFLKKRYSKENKYKKKSLRVNDDESIETSESESSHEDKDNDFMLMAVDDLEMSCTEMNDEDAIVDMEG